MRPSAAPALVLVSIPQAEILAAGGDVDVFAVPDLREKLRRAVDAGKATVVVDLSAATFLDTSALGALLAASRRLGSRGGSLRIATATEDIAKTFALSGTDELLGVYPSCAAALHATA